MQNDIGLRRWAAAKVLKQVALNRQCGNIRMGKILVEYAAYFRTAKHPCLIRSEMDKEHLRNTHNP